MIGELFTPFGCTINKVPIPGSNYCTYNIRCNNIDLNTTFVWDQRHSLELVLRPIIYKFISVLTNGAKFDSKTEYDEGKFKDFIDTYYLTLTPDEKLDAILEYINKSTSFDGQVIEITTPNKLSISKMYFNNSKEWEFYLSNAREQGYIQKLPQIRVSTTGIEGLPPKLSDKYSLTISGLTRLISINDRKASRYCFVAMAFTSEMEAFYLEAIEPAIRTCGFEPYIVNKVNVESDKTINDAILAGIKKARFTIADFTYHREGVYFEAGYALGRGQNVIYTCREDEMSKAHFDIRNYQHIVWSDANDLKEKLINKIEAFIKD